MALCTQADVEKRLQWDITSEPDSVVTSLIEAAQAHIEAEVGRPLESASWSETFDGGYGVLFLRGWPVTAVTSVTEDGVALTVDDDFKWYANGKLIRLASDRQTAWRILKAQSIVVSYTGGYEAGTPELKHLGSLCAEVVARAFRRGAASAATPAGTAGAIQSVSLEGSDTITYATASGESVAGGLTSFVFLEQHEIDQLSRYKVGLV